ncbi:uncharacterized protein N0V89_011404 [Didymosphaeria variabile]|uniref:C2H2-type domain-containing protein n=1 Tax=Didymosphaeria variabile TaxID=1932322 RepID=A0A9W9C5Q0_9PLEO|nr:uncharacterized protein N0V89_011404 [Didymosphaeria variabile]KAJ4345274.1 hypothetical protein N0V89_011404 [Didymosphaeria variabile]
MEPPAKRMRILQSIGVDEVDESNPEYIKGKQQNSEWLKNKWNSIYAKYGAMPDMMSDEVDMRGNGSIVVDRGHMRKLDKEYRNRLGRQRRTMMPAEDDTQLVDDMFANDKEMNLEEEEEDHDERDELAPSQSPEPAPLKLNSLPHGSASHQHVSPIARSNGQTDIPVPNTPTNATLQATLAASTNPAADLIQLVQFPQTPAGQQARKAFEAQTAQAVQQAVASIFSSLLSNVPSLQSPQLNLLQEPETPVTPVLDTREVAPATVPSLYHPSPPVVSEIPAATQPSPVPVPQNERKKRRLFAVGVHIKPKRHDSTREDIPLVMENDATQATEELASELSISGDMLNNDQLTVESPQERYTKIKKCFFTAEEDQYIIESRVLHNRPWAEIINSRPHWQNWKKNRFWAHWRNVLREKAANMNPGESGLVSIGIQNDAEIIPKESTSLNKERRPQPHSSPAAARHLPTPSSLGHDEDKQQNEEPISKNSENIIASGGHFDEDERDLLSLYGDTGPMCDVQADSLGGNTDEDLNDAREIPETPLNLTQETSLQAVLQGTVTREPTVDVTIASSAHQTKPSPTKITRAAATKANGNTTNVQTPSTNRPTAGPTSSVLKKSTNKSRTSITYRADPDSDSDVDLIASEPPSSALPSCPLCKQTFPAPALLQTHMTQPHPKEIHVRASSPLPTLDQADELHTQTPTTPLVAIKREPLDDHDDPPINLLTTPTFKTPTSAPQRTAAGVHSSGAKSTGKMSRSAYNQVKRSWARKGTPVARKRQSLGKVEVARKRFWDDVGDGSEDELAM